jgi:hypothetical protein
MPLALIFICFPAFLQATGRSVAVAVCITAVRSRARRVRSSTGRLDES